MKSGRFVELSKYDLLIALQKSGVLVREYGIHPAYRIEFDQESETVVIFGATQRSDDEPA